MTRKAPYKFESSPLQRRVMRTFYPTSPSRRFQRAIREVERIPDRVHGSGESGTARLEEAVAAYRAALEEWSRDRVPLDWAMTQNSLGNAPVGRSGGARRESRLNFAAYR